jgi:hypothetical protein
MSKKWKPSSPWLHRKVKQGFRGYPIATIAFYGPTAELATKVVVAIVRDEGCEPDPLERWFSVDRDVRTNPAVGQKVLAFLKENAATSYLSGGHMGTRRRPRWQVRTAWVIVRPASDREAAHRVGGEDGS